MNHILRSSMGAVIAGIIAAGCSTTPPASNVAAANTAIGNAQQAIDQASADPHVAKYAASELERASASLQKAKTAWNDKHDLTTTTHFAYIAQQRAATAQEFAGERAAGEAVTVAAAERDQVYSSLAARSGKPKAITELAQKDLVGFAPGRAKIPASAKRALDALAATLKSNPEREVVIEGYTDNIGGPRYNQALAMRRADAVRVALLQRGIDSGRIAIRSHGEQNPAASNKSRIGRLENRRAEVVTGDSNTQMLGSSQISSTTSSDENGQSRQPER
ncbi:OmpA family protein [Massilia timonae]|uniref:OmpA family protein n=1 Tax=Massilia timonae TaxID=47229 RepID=A0A1S2NB21_9BURK|nr:OmpA family protein [Massilia timonae]OIJ41854.1 ompA family protein [Massilia timonae]